MRFVDLVNEYTFKSHSSKTCDQHFSFVMHIVNMCGCVCVCTRVSKQISTNKENRRAKKKMPISVIIHKCRFFSSVSSLRLQWYEEKKIYTK